MAKKSISDLIQEEAQKLTPTEESVIEVDAVEIPEQEDSAVDETATPNSTRRTNPTKADLEVTIKELKETLEQSQKKEKNLQKKITDLQSALTEQQAAAERLTKELNEAKNTVLQLADSNSKLIEENNSLKQEKENKAAEKEKEKEKENKSSIQVREKYNPVGYKKSHRISEKLPEAPKDTNDDFSANTWLYD